MVSRRKISLMRVRESEINYDISNSHCGVNSHVHKRLFGGRKQNLF